jgi:hypothetical protein
MSGHFEPAPAGEDHPNTPHLEVARAAKSEKARQEKAALAEKNQREFVARIAGSRARLTLLPRELLQAVAFGVAEVSLMKVLTGEVPIKTAKEAADVAKIALDIGRIEVGDPTSIHGEYSPEQREDLIANAKALRAELEKRQREAEKHGDSGWDGEGSNPVPADSEPGSSTAAGESASVSA